MAQKMLLLNPRRRKARKTTTTKRRRRNPVAPRPAAVARRTARRVARRRNPVARVARRVMRRRRNPIALGGTARSAVAMLKEAMIGGAGAIAVDYAMGQANRFLPVSLQRVPGSPGVGDLVKAVLTVLLGRVLSRPTRGMSVKMAQGALTVQAHGLMAGFLPSTMTLGYSVPGRVVDMNTRIGPNSQTLQRYTRPGVTPLLNRYTGPGVSPILGARNAAMARDGINVR